MNPAKEKKKKKKQQSKRPLEHPRTFTNQFTIMSVLNVVI